MDKKWRIYNNTHKQGAAGGNWDVPGPGWRHVAPLPDDIVDPENNVPPRHFRPVDPLVAEVPPDFYYLASATVIDTVNLAIRLRRPILVTGAPGTGKTSLAYSIASELGLGPVLEWLITSRSTVRDGLYQYDALARVSDMNLADKAGDEAEEMREAAWDIGRYITLGPLGDALLPRPKPRVLLVDEIDKCDIDLPGDLLHVLDRGTYEIPELVRDRAADIRVYRADTSKPEYESVWIHRGRVRCHEYPIVILTSNDEREFPPAFQRRCLQIRLKPPTEKALREIATRKLGPLGVDAGDLIQKFANNDPDKGMGDDGRKRATSQLLNALYVIANSSGLSEEESRNLCEIALAPLNE